MILAALRQDIEGVELDLCIMPARVQAVEIGPAVDARLCEGRSRCNQQGNGRRMWLMSTAEAIAFVALMLGMAMLALWAG